MNVRELLEQVASGVLSLEEAEHRLRGLAFEDIGDARVDHHRSMRRGFPEVLYCPGKTLGQAEAIFARLAEANDNVLATRASEEIAARLVAAEAGAVWDPIARTVSLHRDETDRGVGRVLVVTAGTADLPAAREALVTARVMGNRAELITDVGVAGIHRLMAVRKQLEEATVLVVVAGMEGALPSVVAGLVSRPVIAVPTSAGYGASFGGVTALLAMLNSCAAGVTVVNIDNGFGAAYAASLINRAR